MALRRPALLRAFEIGHHSVGVGAYPVLGAVAPGYLYRLAYPEVGSGSYRRTLLGGRCAQEQIEAEFSPVRVRGDLSHGAAFERQNGFGGGGSVGYGVAVLDRDVPVEPGEGAEIEDLGACRALRAGIRAGARQADLKLRDE